MRKSGDGQRHRHERYEERQTEDERKRDRNAQRHRGNAPPLADYIYDGQSRPNG